MRTSIVLVGTVAGVAGIAGVGIVGTAMAGPDGPGSKAAPTATASSSTAPSPAPSARARPAQRPERPRGETSPVAVDLPGWVCGAAADEKFICDQGTDSVVVTWRRAAEHAEYLSIGKSGSVIFVSDVHGPWFATVLGGPETTQAVVDEVGRGMVWQG